MLRLKLVLCIFIAAVAVNASAEKQAVDEAAMCKYSADHMIEIAKQSLLDKNSRPERIEKRRKLVEAWMSKMENGVDPCEVYKDIQQAGNTF